MYAHRLRIFFIAAAGLPFTVAAADTAPAASPSYNWVLIALVSLSLVLAFAVGALGLVLRNVVQAHREKNRKQRLSKSIITTVLLMVLFAAAAMPASAQADSTTATASAAMPALISGMPAADFYLVVGIIGFEVLIMMVLLYHISGLTRALRDLPERQVVPVSERLELLWKLMNGYVAVKDEAAITLDHEYDGIRELDNDLPPWWKYGFAVTVIVAFIYIGYYHFGGGPSQAEEYTAAVIQAEAEQAAYLAKSANNVDEHSVTLVNDEAALGDARNIFQTTCAACHAKDGGGGVGPNLTDTYWLHGGSVQDVFKSIKYGWTDKGMKSWKDDFSPRQIAALASYVVLLKGTQPAAPKAPQGIPYTAPDGKEPAAHKDSTAAATAMN